MPNELHATIRRLADVFAQGIVDALRAEARRGSRPGRKAKSTTRGESVDVLLADMLELLERNPQGLHSEELRAQLKVAQGPFQVILKEAIAAALIKKVGKKGTTTFRVK